MKRLAVIILAVVVFTAVSALSQSQEVHNYLHKLAQGKVDEVKKALPDLLIDYPDDPGVILLHAAVIVDGSKALERYKKIVTQYPASEWADDAYWRIVQYYAIIGDTTNARKELEVYRSKCPKSEFLIAATEAVKASVAYVRSTSAEKKAALKKESQSKVTDTKENKKNKIQQKKNGKDAQVKKETPAAESKAAPEEATEKTVRKDDGIGPKTDKNKYGLQIGVYGSEETARSQVELYRKQRLIANIYPKKVGDADMFAVVIGDYAGKESAEKARELVQTQCKCVPILYEK